MHLNFFYFFTSRYWKIRQKYIKKMPFAAYETAFVAYFFLFALLTHVFLSSRLRF